MKQNYVTGMNKIAASDALREKTVAAMNAQNKRPKQAVFKKRYIAIAAAACLVIVAATPSAIYMLNTKSASPMQAQYGMGAKENELNAGGEQQDTAQSMAAASPHELKQSRNALITIDTAQEIAKNGDAFLENAEQTGGYEVSGLEILKAESLTDENGEAYFKITAKTNSGEEIILIVK